MRLLIDECLPHGSAVELRSRGHDIISAGHVCPGDDDADVLARATAEQRLVVTEDRDYGTLVLLHRQPALGIVLVQLNDFAGPLLDTDSRLAEIVHAMRDQIEGNSPSSKRDRFGSGRCLETTKASEAPAGRTAHFA